MGKRGPKKKYDTPEALETAVEAYMADCERQGVFPDLAGMRLALGVSKTTLDRYAKGRDGKAGEDDETAAAYREVLDRAKDKRESWLVRKMTSDNKAAQGCLNALKQPDNGGYIDRPVESGERTLTVNLVGVGSEAFK